ncbi:MAG: nicotinate (nicotinamide) nucleotide adenylyltransferase [Lentimicrobiaceae bacterium]|nr:nicotinate (nicotinamide) nucleotide adenylyltransferase [Lentimicrobiaceae bacterium]
MHIGLYFGTFNPVHKGHLAVAEGMYRQGLFDAVWFVVSPSSPFKTYSQLLDERKRLDLVNVAIEKLPYCLVSDVEFTMERPSYTYLTLRKLKETYPKTVFSIIMGEDNLDGMEKWKNYEEIMQNHSIFVYPRAGIWQKKDLKNVFYIDLPLLNISSNQIRERLQKGESIEKLVPKNVVEMIEKEGLYGIFV